MHTHTHRTIALLKLNDQIKSGQQTCLNFTHSKC